MNAGAATSKSFRAQLPVLSSDELERLRRWGAENCAASVLHPEDSCVMWLVTRERARTREDFARAVRGTFKKLSLDASRLKKGHWLVLACDEAVRAEVAASQAASATKGAAPWAVNHSDVQEVRIIPLTLSGRGGLQAPRNTSLLSDVL